MYSKNCDLKDFCLAQEIMPEKNQAGQVQNKEEDAGWISVTEAHLISNF